VYKKSFRNDMTEINWFQNKDLELIEKTRIKKSHHHTQK